MSRLYIRVSYNTTLFSFVDSLSTWDHFVSKHINKYFHDNYGIGSQDQKLLDQYAQIRRQLNWEKEIDLFNWAFSGYQDHPGFNELLPAIRYFETKKNNTGVSLKFEIEKETKKLSQIRSDVEKRFEKLCSENTIKVFTSLFGNSSQSKLIPCYLTYSPDIHATQGGANGDGIYTEVSTGLNKNLQINETISVILHEYTHKTLKPGEYLRKRAKIKKDNIYDNEYSSIYPGPYSAFVEEAIIYTICDVFTLGTDPLEQRNNFIDRNDNEMKIIWQSVHDISPILHSYLIGADTSTDTFNLLDNYFHMLKLRVNQSCL